MEVVGLGLGVESEFDVSDEWDLNIFLSVILGVTGAGAGTLDKFGISLLDEAFSNLWDTGLGADSEFDLVKINHSNIFDFLGFGVKSEFNISDEWDLDIFLSIILGVTGFGAGTLGKFGISLLDVGFNNLWDGSFGADSEFDLVKFNHSDIFNFLLGKDVIEELHGDGSDDWDGKGLGSIGVFVTLISAVTDSESSEVFSVFLVGGGEGNLSATVTFNSSEEGNLVGSDGFAEKGLWVESAHFVLELHVKKVYFNNYKKILMFELK